MIAHGKCHYGMTTKNNWIVISLTSPTLVGQLAEVLLQPVSSHASPKTLPGHIWISQELHGFLAALKVRLVALFHSLCNTYSTINKLIFQSQETCNAK